jgi:hypothetical protein
MRDFLLFRECPNLLAARDTGIIMLNNRLKLVAWGNVPVEKNMEGILTWR